MEYLLQLKQVDCSYGSKIINKDINIDLAQNEIGCLLGQSGCGKSTLLRAIAGFMPLSKGSIHLNSKLLSNANFSLAPEKRKIGMVFQDYALFSHLSVEENILFGVEKLEKAKKKETLNTLLDLINMQSERKKYPHQISGGQQQRVALARALAPKPQIILMDEPFSNLDAHLRSQLVIEVRTMLKELGIAGLLVTHDQKEAFAMADKIGILHDCNLAQWDTPENIYLKPKDSFVASFIGGGIFIDATANSNGIESELGFINHKHKYNPNTKLKLLLRPLDINVEQATNGKANAKVLNQRFAGLNRVYKVKLNSGKEFKAILDAKQNFSSNTPLNISLNPRDLIVFES